MKGGIDTCTLYRQRRAGRELERRTMIWRTGLSLSSLQPVITCPVNLFGTFHAVSVMWTKRTV